jgi:hypothetical protein
MDDITHNHVPIFVVHALPKRATQLCFNNWNFLKYQSTNALKLIPNARKM